MKAYEDYKSLNAEGMNDLERRFVLHTGRTQWRPEGNSWGRLKCTLLFGGFAGCRRNLSLLISLQ